MKLILQYCNMAEYADLDVLCDLDVAEARLKRINRDKWWVDCHGKPKLRTYIQIHDRNKVRTVVSCNLSRKHRSKEHFLLVCTELEETRMAHMDIMKVDDNVPSKNNIERMKFLLNSTNLKNFCLMLEDMLDQRKELLYNKVE